MIAGCAPFLTTGGRFIRPHVEFAGTRLIEGSASGFVVSVDLDVFNKSEETLRVDGYTYRAEINRLPVASGDDTAGVELPGNGRVRVSVPVTVTFRDLKTALSRVDWLQGGFEKAILTVTGTITIKRLGLKFPVPFSVSRSVKSATKRFSKESPAPDPPDPSVSPREEPTPR